MQLGGCHSSMNWTLLAEFPFQRSSLNAGLRTGEAAPGEKNERRNSRFLQSCFPALVGNERDRVGRLVVDVTCRSPSSPPRPASVKTINEFIRSLGRQTSRTRNTLRDGTDISTTDTTITDHHEARLRSNRRFTTRQYIKLD